MSRQQIETSIKSLIALVLEGKSLEAFDQFYHDEVSMQENHLPATVSKAANLKRSEEFLSNVIEFRGATVLGLAVGDGISYVTWHYDYTHKEWGVRNYTQVSVQKWQDGKIIHEQFFYNS